MSVAQELAERSGHGVDFQIRVFEKRADRPGGKARTIPVPGSGRDGRPDLPGEHGFRFFSGFYKHIPDTMARIPFAGGKSVFDNLVVAPRMQLGRMGKPPVIVASRFPASLGDLVTGMKALFCSQLDLAEDEVVFFATRIWQVLTSCQARRLAEYEKITWHDYLKADDFSQAYRELLVSGLSRSLLANDPTRASARTVGDTDIQLMLGILEPGHPVDRLLNGPTSDQWITPWLNYIQSLGVDYSLDCEVLAIRCGDGEITGVHVRQGGVEIWIDADAYVFALPVPRQHQWRRFEVVN